MRRAIQARNPVTSSRSARKGRRAARLWRRRARRRGARRMRIFTTSVSATARLAARARRARRAAAASWSHGLCACGTKIWAASTSTIQCRAAALHWSSARSRPPYSSTGPSWIIVSSRCVSGLSNGWRPVSASTTSANADRAEREPRRRPGVASRRPGDDPARSVVPATSAATASESTSAASVKTLTVRSRLAPMSAKPLPVSHAAAHTVKRARASRPPSASMLCPTPRSGASAATGTRSTAATTAAATTGGASRYTSVVPSTSILVRDQSRASSRYGCSGDGPRRPCRRAFQCCTSPTRSGRSDDPAHDLDDGRREGLAAHPITPIRTAASRRTTSATR